MKVSIITAVYNGESEIAATLDSIASQDHPDVEHVVIDGGSSDATLSLVARHGTRVRKCVSEGDRGVYDAFNKGLRIATGEVIAFLNAGDVYTDASVVSRMCAMLRDTTLDAVFADVLIVDARDRRKVLRRYESRHFTPQRMRFGLMPAHPTLFMRREIYDRIGGYDPGFRIAGDYELCLRAFLAAGARYRHLREAIVRMPSGGLSNRGWRSKLTITREMMTACRRNRVATSYLRLSMRFAIKARELWRP